MRMPFQQYGDQPPTASEITPRVIVESRRDFMRQLAVGSVTSAAVLEMLQREAFAQNPSAQKLAAAANSNYLILDKKTSYKDATTYNSF